MFKLLIRNSNPSRFNQIKYSWITLKDRISTIYDHQDLVGFTSEQKISIIDSLSEAIDLEQLKSLTFLSEDQMRNIMDFIKNSEEYIQYESAKNRLLFGWMR